MSNGSTPGGAYAVSSGGGSIKLFFTEYIEQGTVSVSSPTTGSASAGGSGSIRIQQIQNFTEV